MRFHERIRLGAKGGGRLVEDDVLFAALKDCEVANCGQPITFFEVTTAAAFKLFNEHPADYVLLETGLGGRFDATNVVARPQATVITPVSIDHPEFLGPTIDKIAYAKTGILKSGSPAIFSVQQDQVIAVLERQANRVGAPFHLAARDYDCREEHGRLVYEDKRGLLDLPLPRLIGHHQHQNAAAAIATLRTVEPALSSMSFEEGMVRTEWPARLQNLNAGRVTSLAPAGAEIWLDGGHNADAGRAIAQAMAEFEERKPRPLVVVCGFLASKDTGGFLEPFNGLAQEVLAVPVNADQYAKPAADVATAANAKGFPAAVCDSVKSALLFLAARDWQLPPRILITGSLYLAGEVLALNGTPPD